MIILVRHGEPWVLEKGLGCWALRHFPLQNRQEEVRKHISLFFLESILLHEQTLKWEVTQLVNILEHKLARSLITLEELGEEGATDGVVLGHGS